MAVHRVELLPAAEKELEKLPADVQRAVVDKLTSLGQDPRGGGVRKLAGTEDLYRVKVRKDYRIVYQVQSRALLVLVIRVRHRREAYRGL